MDNIKKYLFYYFKKTNFEKEEILATFDCDSIDEIVEEIYNYVESNYEELLSYKDFYVSLNSLLVYLVGMTNDNIELIHIRKNVSDLLDLSKNYNKPYNKGEIAKDGLYHVSNNFKNSLSYDLELIDNLLLKNDRRFDNYRIMEFIIFNLKTPDYLYRILETNPDFINLRNSDNIHLFRIVCEYYLSNIKNLDDEDIKYFKRIIVMMLESDKLKIRNNDIDAIFALASIIDKDNSNPDVQFLLETISRYFATLNADSRITSIDHTHMKSPVVFSKVNPKDYYDLRDEFVVSVDGTKNSNMDRILFDDAFSAYVDENGHMHLVEYVADVDSIVKSGSPTDNFMRGLGQSVYQPGYVHPLLDYSIAEKIALRKGEDKPAFVFDVTLDENFNVLGIDSYKAIIRVNYNLNKTQVNTFIKYGSNDEKLKMLNLMHDIAVGVTRNRRETIGARKPGQLIVDQFNITPDLAMAARFDKENRPFAFKNYLGKLKINSKPHANQVADFIEDNYLSDESNEMLTSVFDIYNRIFYDTINYGNATYDGVACGSIGNPMREFISLETLRLIDSLLIQGNRDDEYWAQRIENDCVEYTETSSKIKSLYGPQRGR